MTSPIVVVQQPTSVLKIEGHGGPPGAQGEIGPEGPQGPSGPPGGEWQFGAGNPNGVVTGIQYNMYIDTNTSDVYRSNGGTSWTFVNNIKGATGAAGADGADGSDGAAGPAGTRGSLWTSGTGVPSAANNAGDMYLRTATNIGDVYQGNGGTSWSLVGNIRGATGTTGSTGPAGADGNPNIFYNAITSNAAYNTTETTVLTLAGLTAGTYMVEVMLIWESTVSSSFAINYSGSFTSGSSNLSGVRLAGAIAHYDALAFNTLHATSNSTPQTIILGGILVATGSGNLTISMDNSTSGTSAAKRGTFIRASK